MEEVSELQEFTQLLNEEPELEQTPEGGETPTKEEVEALEYYLGEEKGKIPLNAELLLKHNGEIQKLPLEKIINGYRQVSHAEGKFAEAKALREQIEAKQKEYGEIDKLREEIKPFQELQNWSVELEKTDPAGYAYLMDAIDRVKNGTYSGDEQSVAGAFNKAFSSLKEELDGLKQWKQTYESQVQELQAQEDEKAVMAEVETIKKKFPEINLDEIDDNGIKLSQKVINWGADKGYQTFEEAFKNYFFDQLQDILVQRGKNEALKGIKGDYKKGIVSRSSTPVQGHPTEEKSDIELLEDALSQMA